LKVLDRRKAGWTLATATVSSATFVFSPVAMTVILGEVVGSRIKHAYHRLTTVISVRNGVTESTYIAEALIPLIAFGLPLSPVAAGPAAPLFNAPPRFTVHSASGQVLACKKGKSAIGAALRPIAGKPGSHRCGATLRHSTLPVGARLAGDGLRSSPKSPAQSMLLQQLAQYSA
jgi:hypothetical protein